MNGAAVLGQIVRRRRERVGREGHTLGAAVPPRRHVPLAPFPAGGAEQPGFLVAEIKRRSPSAGAIAPELHALEQAGRYAAAGVGGVSILTEEEHFGGSLGDLLAVKERYPTLPVLRKDFLLDEEDLEVSYRCGADAVLLIAAVLDQPTLSRLCRRAAALGMAALVEVHDAAELTRVRPLRPRLTGVNSRDLKSLRVDALSPLALQAQVDWETCLLYESGVRGPEDVLVARAAGFDGVLVGEALVRRPQLVEELLAACTAPRPQGNFWGRLAARRRGPLVKICGLARRADAELAVALGADLLGFILADSPRRARPALLRELRDLPALKVGVVVSEEGGGEAAGELLAEGLLDAVQLHGGEKPEECFGLAFPYYKAVSVGSPEDLAAVGRYLCPRILADARSPQARGGTGRTIPRELVAVLAEGGPLWLAGGLGPENVGSLLRRFRPELMDASSRLEERPGEKDPRLLRRFFQEIAAAAGEGPP